MHTSSDAGLGPTGDVYDDITEHERWHLAEWKPDMGKCRGNPVALIQLASSKVAVLLRVSKQPRSSEGIVTLPPVVVDFLRYFGLSLEAPVFLSLEPVPSFLWKLLLSCLLKCMFLSLAPVLSCLWKLLCSLDVLRYNL